MTDFTTDPEAVYAFATVLVDMGMLGDVDTTLLYFEKPWKWRDEYDLWEAHGFPANDEPAWEGFEEAFDAMVSA
jgi:hypothetical protein